MVICHLKKGDVVEAISGRWKGAQGKVVAVLVKTSRASVEFPRRNKEGQELPYIKKAIRKTQDNPQGGFVDLHPRVHVSNLKVVGEKEKEKEKKPDAKKSKPAKKESAKK
jgi:large subunit ribosomal protein L24